MERSGGGVEVVTDGVEAGGEGGRAVGEDAVGAEEGPALFLFEGAAESPKFGYKRDAANVVADDVDGLAGGFGEAGVAGLVFAPRVHGCEREGVAVDLDGGEPVAPFEIEKVGAEADGEPRDAEEIGGDGAVHGFGDDDIAAAEFGERAFDGPHGIDEAEPGGVADRAPRNATEGAPVWHEADARAVGGSGKGNLGQEIGGVGDGDFRREGKKLGGERAADGVEAPAFIEGGWAAVAGAGAEDDVTIGVGERVLENGADAEEDGGFVGVETTGKEFGPEPRIETVAEIREGVVVVEEHAELIWRRASAWTGLRKRWPIRR